MTLLQSERRKLFTGSGRESLRILVLRLTLFIETSHKLEAIHTQSRAENEVIYFGLTKKRSNKS